MEKISKASDKYRKVSYLSIWCLMCSKLSPKILNQCGCRDGKTVEALYPLLCGELNSDVFFSEKFNDRLLLKDYSKVRDTPVADWILVAEAMQDVLAENVLKKDSAILQTGLLLARNLLSTLQKEIWQSKQFLQKKGYTV